MGLIITTKKTPLPPRIFLYGPGGIGKTTLASKLPGVLLIPVEDGSDALDVARTQQPRTWAELLGILNDIFSTADFPYRSVAIDSLTACEALAGKAVAERNGAVSFEGVSYKGASEVVAEMRKMKDKLDEIRLVKGCAVVVIGHLAVLKYNDPRSSGYDRFAPRLHKDVLPMWAEWSDALLCANYKVYTNETKSGKTLASGEGERMFFCTERPTHLAKNRYSLPDEMPMSWGGIFQGISKAFQPTVAAAAVTQPAAQVVAESEKAV